MKPRFFASAAEFRTWLRDHPDATELLLGFHKKSTGRDTLTYSEALDQALCFGWIDGVRRSLDDASYTIRFSPRRARSIWSRVNLRHVERLTAAGLMDPRGLDVLERRDPRRSGIYSFENAPRRFPAPYMRRFRASPAAWRFFKAQPPGYQRVATFYVLGAKREETRLRRLQNLIDVSGREERLGILARPLKKAKEKGKKSRA